MPAASAPMPRNIVCRRENDPAAGRMHFAKSKGRPIRGGLCLSKSLAEFAARRPRIELATKDNPRLCRGEKIAYGEGQSRQEKVSKLE